jgi:aspartyl/asparaginyl beta-hydroxylase (cupin superfamily)
MDDPGPAPRDEAAAVVALLAEATEQSGEAAVSRVFEAFLALDRPEVDAGGQRPGFRIPGLTAKPWHDPSTLPGTTTLETAADVIRGELLEALSAREGFQTYRQARESFVPKDHWKTMYFLVNGTRVPANRRLCPQTARILDAIPNLFGMAMFSALLPGGHIKPHCGPSNCRLTIHLGLIVPRGCSLRVGDETRSWAEGKCLAFDDTFEHEAWNQADTTRFVLFLDVWHPDLTPVEIGLLQRIQRLADQDDHPQSLPRLMAGREEERGHSWWQ